MTVRPHDCRVPVSRLAVSSTVRVQSPLADSPANADRSKLPFTSSVPPPLRLCTTAVLPDGLVRLMVRSPLYVCLMSRSSFSESTLMSFETVTFDVALPRSGMGAFGVATTVVCWVSPAAAGRE